MITKEKGRKVNTSTLRKLLTEGFSQLGTMSKFIYDFDHDASSRITEDMSIEDMAHEAIVFAQERGQLDKLIGDIKTSRLALFEKYKNELYIKDRSEIAEALEEAGAEIVSPGSQSELKQELAQKTWQIRTTKLSTLKNYVKSLDQCIELIELTDTYRQELRDLGETLKSMDPITSSDKWDITSAGAVIRAIFIPFNRLWGHVSGDLQLIDKYSSERLDFVQEEKEKILKTTSRLRDELNTLEIIEQMHSQIMEQTANESSDLIHGSKQNIEKLRVSIIEMDKSASEIRYGLFKGLKKQVDRLSDEFIDSLLGF